MTIIQRTPDIGIGVRLQRVAQAPAAVTDAATAAGWLAPLQNIMTNGAILPDEDMWLPSRARVAISGGGIDVPRPVLSTVSVVGVVAGRTVVDIKWQWQWEATQYVAAVIEEVDGQLRVVARLIDRPYGLDYGAVLATLTAVATTVSGALPEITLDIALGY